MNHFLFVYKLISINIEIGNDLYTNRRPSIAVSGGDKTEAPTEFVTEPGGCLISLDVKGIPISLYLY